MSYQSPPSTPQRDEDPTDKMIRTFIIRIQIGHIEKIKETVEKCPRICNRLELQKRIPPIFFAAFLSDHQQCYQIMKILIEGGATYNFKDNLNQTVMFYLCRNGHKKTIQYLISKGCRIDEQDFFGQTPVFYAAAQNHLDIMDIFPNKMLSHVDIYTHQTPLFYSAKNGHFQMCKELIDRGCDPIHHDLNKKTALDFAKEFQPQNKTLIEYLTISMRKAREQQSQSVEGESKRKKQKIAQPKNLYKICHIKNNEVHELTTKQLNQLEEKVENLKQYLQHPETIPQELLENVDELWQTKAQKVFIRCWKVKGCFWFHEPVNPVKLGILDYFERIKKPMDLGTVRKRLTHNYYENVGQFKSDMTLVWQNCYTYNGRDHEISKVARQVEKMFGEQMKIYKLQ